MSDAPFAQLPLHAVWLGRRPYAPVLAIQNALREARLADRVGDTVLLLEHDPVITLGRGALPAEVLAGPDLLQGRGVGVERVDRGGQATLHGPGQLVGYPIVRLSGRERDVRRYVSALRDTMADLVAPWGLSAGAMPDLVGLWVDTLSPAHWPGAESARRPCKLGAIGVRLSRWVSSHGFALNLNVDLSLFQLIIPCGISAYGVTSAAQLLGESPPPSEVAPSALKHLALRLGRLPGTYHDLSHLRPEALGSGAVLRALGATPDGLPPPELVSAP